MVPRVAMFTTAGETRLIMGASVGTGASPTAAGSAAWLDRTKPPSSAKAATRAFFGGFFDWLNMTMEDTQTMLSFLLWCLLLVVCWPLALLALLLWPFVWLVLLPFRLIGIAVEGVFELLRAIIMLPGRVLGGRP